MFTLKVVEIDPKECLKYHNLWKTSYLKYVFSYLQCMIGPGQQSFEHWTQVRSVRSSSYLTSGEEEELRFILATFLRLQFQKARPRFVWFLKICFSYETVKLFKCLLIDKMNTWLEWLIRCRLMPTWNQLTKLKNSFVLNLKKKYLNRDNNDWYLKGWLSKT